MSDPALLDEFLPVLSVVLVDETKGQNILVGIRNEAVNKNHPNVVSVPTMRVPVGVGREIMIQIDAGRLPQSITQPGIAHDVIGYALWSLLAVKLGLADTIEMGQFDLRVLAACSLQGHSLIDYIDGQDVTESLTMISLLCVVDRGASDVPTSNSVFSHMTWLDYELLVDTATTKNLFALNQEFHRPEVCIHGLCIKTAMLLFPKWQRVANGKAMSRV